MLIVGAYCQSLAAQSLTARVLLLEAPLFFLWPRLWDACKYEIFLHSTLYTLETP